MIIPNTLNRIRKHFFCNTTSKHLYSVKDTKVKEYWLADLYD